MNEIKEDEWAWWKRALLGEVGPIDPSTPKQGFYRCRRKDGQWEAVAIWISDGAWHALRRGRPVENAEDLWTWCAQNPISYAAYNQAMHGGGFDDEPPAESPQSQPIH